MCTSGLGQPYFLTDLEAGSPRLWCPQGGFTPSSPLCWRTAAAREPGDLLLPTRTQVHPHGLVLTWGHHPSPCLVTPGGPGNWDLNIWNLGDTIRPIIEARHFFHAPHAVTLHCSATTWGWRACLPLTERQWGLCGPPRDGSQTGQKCGLQVTLSAVRPSWLGSFFSVCKWLCPVCAGENRSLLPSQFQNAELSFPFAKVFVVFLVPALDVTCPCNGPSTAHSRVCGGCLLLSCVVFCLPPPVTSRAPSAPAAGEHLHKEQGRTQQVGTGFC